MFDKLKQAIGRALVSSPALPLVEEAFNGLASADKSLPRDIANFVAADGPATVLARITAIPDAAERSGILSKGVWSLDLPKYKAQRQLIESLGSWNPATLLRLAQVYDAGSRGTSASPIAQRIPPAWQGGYEWLDQFLRQVTNSPHNMWSSQAKAPPVVSLAAVESMVAANQQDPAQILRGALLVDPTIWGWAGHPKILQAFPDFKETLERFPQVVREAFQHTDFRVKVLAMETLASANADAKIWLEELTDFLTVSSKQVRQAAEPLARSIPDSIKPGLELRAKDGDNDVRLYAVQSYHRIFGDTARAFLQERLAAEKSKKVKETLASMLAISDPSLSVGDELTEPAKVDQWGLLPLPVVNLKASLKATVRDDLTACFTKAYADAYAAYERIKHQKWAGKFDAVQNDKLIGELFDDLQTMASIPVDRAATVAARSWRDGQKHLNNFAGHPQFELIHAVRWSILIHGAPVQTHWFYWSSPIFTAFTKAHGMRSLREFGSVFDALGLDGDYIGRGYLAQTQYARVGIFKQSPENVWPYFAERIHLLEQALGVAVSAASPHEGYMARYYESFERKNSLGVLKAFPRTPKRLLPVLWDIALTGAKAERLDAQAALSREPETVKRLIAALGDRQQETRSEAAAWLGRMEAKESIPALLSALEKEKKDLPRSALMLALEVLGVATEKLVDRRALEDEAEKLASKPLPADLEWFSFTALPVVHWAGDNGLVSKNLLRLLLVQSLKLKNPEPGPLLRTYAKFFKPDDRAKLGRFVLETWIAQDTIPAHTSEEAGRQADAQTQQMKAFYVQHPKYAEQWDEQKHYRAVYKALLAACKGSAIDSKGILALAGACATGEVASTVHRYIKQYFGMRGAQCKAMLQMLSWIDDSNAIQVLLAIGNRFRTKGIQEEASRLCQVLAERKEWTLDELADRTIPTAGFDEEGALELDFGARTFTAKLASDFTIVLSNADGKQISSLPEPNQSDDEAKASAAKSQYSAARKELKTILKLQTARFYEGLCTQRSWRYGDFRANILLHPIVGRLCERLVWCEVREGKTGRTFRPMPDKTLTNTEDDEVKLTDDTVIRLAHEATLTAEDRDKWVLHLKDYKIEPLFEQFNKPLFSLSKERETETELTDFNGHVLENFKLRGRLNKQGYTRGQAQDGGWFSEYHKRFPGLGVQATINFSGSPLPEENRPVALQSLTFQRIGNGQADQGDTDSISLSELPAVLLSECWNDMRIAAAEGKGFDSNWEKTVQY